MRLLVVSEAYVPTVHAEAFCTARLAQALAADGHDVTVLTREGDHIHDALTDPSPRWQRADGVDVRRVPSSVRGWRRLRDHVAALTTGVPGLKAWHRDACDAALALHRERPFDVVMTRHVSERTAWIGRAIRRAGAVWIANFADPAPPCLHPPPHGPGAARTRSDRRCVHSLVALLAEADAISWPCERLADFHVRALGLGPARRLLIPHIGGAEGPDGARSPSRPTPARDDGREIRLVHAGLWMKDRFVPDLVCAIVLAAAHAQTRGVRLVVELLGPAKPDLIARIRDAGAAHVVVLSGHRSHDACMATLEAADGLLLSEAVLAEGIYLPTRLADYATARRPVLAFSPATGTASDVLGLRHPGLLGQTTEGARAGLVSFVDAFLDGPPSRLVAWHVPDPERFGSRSVAAGVARDAEELLASRLASRASASASPRGA